MKCEKCGAELREDERVCPVCGREAAETEAVTAASAGEPDGAAGIEAEGAGAGAAETEVDTEAGAETNTETNTLTERASADLETPPKGKKNKKAILIGGGVVAVAAAAAIAVTATRKDPKDIVLDAFQMAWESRQQGPAEQIFGVSQFMEPKYGESTETSLRIQVDDEPSEDNPYPVIDTTYLNGFGLRLDSKTDGEALKSRVDLAVTYQDMDVAGLHMYYGDRVLMASVPELVDRVFLVDLNEGLADRLRESPLLSTIVEYGELDADALEAYVNQALEQAEHAEENQFDIKGLYERYKEACKAQDELKAAMVVEKGTSSTFTIDGESVSGQGYEVHIDKQALFTFLRDTVDFVLQDEAYQKAYEKQLEMATNLLQIAGERALGTEPELPPSLSESSDEVRAQTEQLIQFLDQHMQDIDMTVYVDKEGRLAMAELRTVLMGAAEGAADESADSAAGDAQSSPDEVQAALQLTLKGGNYLTENMSGVLSLSQGEEKILLSYDKQESNDGTKIETAQEFALSDGTEQNASLKTNSSYQIESGEYQLGAVLGYADPEMGDQEMPLYTVKGVITELEKGTSIAGTLDELEIGGGEYHIITLSGDFSYGPLSSELTELEGEQWDVMAGTWEDYEEVSAEASSNVFGLLMEVMSLMSE